MLGKLILKNFQQHADLTINFTEGLQVIRGANEAGKSTLYRAIFYALYGSRALELALEEYVTYGQPLSSMSVDLTFTHVGVTFNIVRKKSGAVLTGPGVTANGHAEVTAFVERLFGASLSVGASTLLAGQNKLQDGLDSSSLSLIEKLSNMGLIDELVTRIQDRLPCGNTKVLEQKYESLGTLVEPVADFTTQESELVVAKGVVEAADAQVAALKPQVLAAVEAAKAASTRLQQQAANDAERTRLTQRRAALNPVPSLSADTADIPALETRQALQEYNNKLIAASMIFFHQEYPTRFNTVEEFNNLRVEVLTTQETATAKITELKVKRATVAALRINQDSCALCGKMLTDVPEVVAINQKADHELLELDAAIEAETVKVSDAKTYMAELNEVYVTHLERQKRFANMLNYVELQGTVPESAKWVAGDVPKTDGTNYASLIREAHAQQRQNAAEVARAAAEAAEQARIDARLAELPASVVMEGDDGKDAVRIELDAKLSEAVAGQTVSAKQLVTLTYALANAKDNHGTQLQMWEKAKVEKLELKALIDTYSFHNGIIKKLREARPVVAKKLWALVLGAISRYFSELRGTQSIVTRSDKGFEVDGKPVLALSGSTKDILGLAIRMVLQKTFLGTLDFMMLDEPAAAVDDARELDMLGLLSSSGYSQVLLVTHSSLADSFATNLIRV